MFLDEVTITVRGGGGGKGVVSWRREKYVPRGGPDGGDGGKGGDVVFVADPNTDTLSGFLSVKRFEAEDGKSGRGSEMTGHGGEDLLLHVPPGTQVKDAENGTLITDLMIPGERFSIAKGGRGGYGNMHFKSSVRRKPDFAENGEPGEFRALRLELKLVADVGVIGFPSVGKSSLIAAISAARPKIAAYPFTTIVPNLGVVAVGKSSYVVCDLPGLIEGAHLGRGLGERFLRHIERTGVLLHLLDLSRSLVAGKGIDPDRLIDDYHVIRRELRAYSPTLAKKKELVVLNKIDLTSDDLASLKKALKKGKIELFACISTAARAGTEKLRKELMPVVTAARKKRVPKKSPRAAVAVLGTKGDLHRMQDFTVSEEKNRLTVRGKRIEQFTVMTDFPVEGALLRFRNVLERTGLLVRMREAKENGKEVWIGKTRVDNYV